MLAEPVLWTTLPEMVWLTTPTRGRVALWIALAVLWFLFLPQQLAMAGGSNECAGGVVLGCRAGLAGRVRADHVTTPSTHAARGPGPVTARAWAVHETADGSTARPRLRSVETLITPALLPPAPPVRRSPRLPGLAARRPAIPPGQFVD
jgi:hypothetical protein